MANMVELPAASAMTMHRAFASKSTAGRQVGWADAPRLIRLFVGEREIGHRRSGQLSALDSQSVESSGHGGDGIETLAGLFQRQLQQLLGPFCPDAAKDRILALVGHRI